ncbi:MAG: 8-amino-7-oxononanoate synthase [Paludibacteraceae bacterium]|nr:8-amino-7-oxononanoate synthase [Paludibacteraceae bacterium]
MEIEERLKQIREAGTFRSLPHISHNGKYIKEGDAWLLNVSSNDYLGLSSVNSFRKEFASVCDESQAIYTSSSARLLTGNFPIYDDLEALIARRYGREAALLLNSGYHANIGILPAVTTASSLIIADKLVHASIIDGINLSRAKAVRYRHNDYAQLERLLDENHSNYDCVVLVTESIFSMDGDICNLCKMVELKKRYPNVLLYVDEAHAVGACGATGLGQAEEQGVLADVDILVGTFGKALASVGAFVVTSEKMKQLLINCMRSSIFTTALPPINVLWSKFIFEKIPFMTAERAQLKRLEQMLQTAFPERRVSSQIFPFLIGDSLEAIRFSECLKKKGFYALPVRPPTVPEGTSRIRFSLTAQITEEEMIRLIEVLKELSPNLNLD